MKQKQSANPAMVPAPKKRYRLDAAITTFGPTRPVRIRKSGRPHQQIWLRAADVDSNARLKISNAATLDELMCQVTLASLSPSHFSSLRRPPRSHLTKAALWTRDLLDRILPF